MPGSMEKQGCLVEEIRLLRLHGELASAVRIHVVRLDVDVHAWSLLREVGVIGFETSSAG